MKLATKKILASSVKPGQTLAFAEGDFVVKNADFGDPAVHGFCELGGRVAAPWIVTLESGAQIIMHPRHRVTRKLNE